MTQKISLTKLVKQELLVCICFSNMVMTQEDGTGLNIWFLWGGGGKKWRPVISGENYIKEFTFVNANWNELAKLSIWW
jgi:hypothetical protein